MSAGSTQSSGAFALTGKPEPVEIMAPVASLEMVRAAVENRAHAVYAGMPGFNARAKTHGISFEELAEMSAYARLRGVRFYLAFNVVLYEPELDRLPDLLRESISMVHPDAFIVQDPGLALLIRHAIKKIRLHASTQMTLASPDAVAFYNDLSFDRITLPRELSAAEVMDFSRNCPVELELFVHGSLCISYSGQCYTSENFGGRSANRGECAQSCRMEYELLVDGVSQRDGKGFYPVSPRDLSLDEGLSDLLKGAKNIRAIKIEGRSKSPEYVAAAVRKYTNRNIVDSPETSLTFAREKNDAWFRSRDYLALVPGDFNSHRGLDLGAIVKISEGWIYLSGERRLRAGDGVLFTGPGVEQGGPVFRVEKEGRSGFRIQMGRDFRLQRLSPGMRVHFTGSPGLEKNLRRTWTDKEHWLKIPLRIRAKGKAGETLFVEAMDDRGNRVSAQSESLLEIARSSSLSRESLEKELGALGGSVYRLEDLDADLAGDLFLHGKELKNIRRDLCEKIDHLRLEQGEVSLFQRDEIAFWMKKQRGLFTARKTAISIAGESAEALRVEIVCRSHASLDAILESKVSENAIILLDFSMGESLTRAVAKLTDASRKWGVVTPRVIRQGDERSLNRLLELEPSYVLSSSPAALHRFATTGAELIGDFGLNVTNSLAASFFLERGASFLTPSTDLSPENLESLLGHTHPGNFIFPVYGHAAGFYMEFCLFARFLAEAADERDCGRVCVKHTLELKDHTGMQHIVTAEKNCRNTLYYGKPFNRMNEIDSLVEKGAGGIRLDFLDESREEILSILNALPDSILQLP